MAEEENEKVITEETEESKTTEVIEEDGQKELSETEKTTERTEKVTPDDDWRSKSRKNETRAKKAERERDELRQQLQERDKANQTEQEKAIEAAREEGRQVALTETQKVTRSKDLELAVNRLKDKGVTLGDGDDAQTVKFADKGVLLILKQGLESEDIDPEDLFDKQGRVQIPALRAAVAEILTDDAWLVERAPEAERPRGSSDAGRGQGGGKSLEEMSPDDHLKAIQTR